MTWLVSGTSHGRGSGWLRLDQSGACDRHRLAQAGAPGTCLSSSAPRHGRGHCMGEGVLLLARWSGNKATICMVRRSGRHLRGGQAMGRLLARWSGGQACMSEVCVPDQACMPLVLSVPSGAHAWSGVRARRLYWSVRPAWGTPHPLGMAYPSPPLHGAVGSRLVVILCGPSPASFLSF